jgi:hypothetical protein
VQKYSYDGLPEYGTYDFLRAEEVLARVDKLLDDGALRSTGGAYPKLLTGEPVSRENSASPPSPTLMQP